MPLIFLNLIRNFWQKKSFEVLKQEKGKNMLINSVSNSPAFKAYIPVKYYAKRPDDNKYHIIDGYGNDSNKRRCNRNIVMSLNGTKKSDLNTDIVELFNTLDSDYRKSHIVRSHYLKDTPYVYIITGNRDVNTVDEMAKPIGIAKSESLQKYNSAKSLKSGAAVESFLSRINNYLINSCKRVKDENGNKVFLQVLFNPVYDKKGKIKKFEYVKTNVVPDNIQ